MIDTHLMRYAFKVLSLLLLLLAAQQGALVHEIGHLSGAIDSGLQVQSDPAADTSCALCPAFAQVVTPAFSHSFQVPLLVRCALEPVAQPPFQARDSSVPTPRSRGPPSLG
jgi:hypothetical protein